jgi:hypothetical protein
MVKDNEDGSVNIVLIDMGLCKKYSIPEDNE